MNTIFITGASRGIGFETVLELSKDPSNRVIAVSRNYERLSQLKESCAKLHTNEIDIVAFDLTKEADFTKLDEALSEVKRIDVLINNAGLLINKPFEELSIAEWRRMFEVNVFGVAGLIQFLLPRLRQSPAAHIVNIGSMGGFQGSSKFPGLSGYSAAKAALANLTECLAAELGRDHIKSNCLCLGAVNTEMLATAFPGYEAPLRSEEMARFIAWFSLNGRQFFNGQVLPVALNDPG
jgi:short-subunit dehydrogenase